MTIERRSLAKIDRCLLAKLDGDGGPQLVKVPVSSAVWDVWRRYCRLAGVSMGEGLAILLAGELRTEAGEELTPDGALGSRIAVRAAALLETVAEQQRRLGAAREQLGQRDEQIRSLQQQLRAVQDEVGAPPSRAAYSPQRVGRNERCPCGSGLKYKFCEGLNHRPSGG